MGMPEQTDVNTHSVEAFARPISDCCGCLSLLCKSEQKIWFWVRIWYNSTERARYLSFSFYFMVFKSILTT